MISAVMCWIFKIVTAGEMDRRFRGESEGVTCSKGPMLEPNLGHCGKERCAHSTRRATGRVIVLHFYVLEKETYFFVISGSL